MKKKSEAAALFHKKPFFSFRSADIQKLIRLAAKTKNTTTERNIFVSGLIGVATSIKNIQVNYTATPKTIESLERSMRLADDVIRYMTIKLEPEAVEAEDAEAIIPDAEEPVTTADVAVADVAVAAAE